MSYYPGTEVELTALEEMLSLAGDLLLLSSSAPYWFSVRPLQPGFQLLLAEERQSLLLA